jgi:hypothetical protein
MRANLRAYDPIVRFGGDEFICGISSIDSDEVEHRIGVIDQSLRAATGVGITAGLATLTANESLDELTCKADAALIELSATAATDGREGSRPVGRDRGVLVFAFGARSAASRLALMAGPWTRTAASLLVECLAAEGCEYVFRPRRGRADTRALSRQDAVTHITTRHEQGAAFMADVYGRLTGRAAVAMSTLGPGATNLVTGIADAYLDRAPMVALTGQAGSDKIHKEAHQFVDIVRMLEPVRMNQRREPGAIPDRGAHSDA